MKKFFDDIKKDIKFKQAGPGKKLTDDASKAPVAQGSAPTRARQSPTDGAQRAGAAALARVEQQQRPRVHTSHDAIRNQVKRELEAEAAAVADEKKEAESEESTLPVKDPASLSVSGVFFTCPLTGATLTKAEREVRVKEAILMWFSEDPVEASVMMVHTFNKDREKVKAAVDIISRYTENICKNPTEEKYRKIKVSNKVFQEKMSCVEGSREFLQSLGFQSTMLSVDGQEEEFLLLPEQEPSALEVMKEKLSRLQKGEPVRAQLDRQLQVYRPSPDATHFELPPDFYNLSAEELKREQQLKNEVVERNAMLRTKAMREKEEQRERRKYNYALLRVRMPDGNILQGRCWENEEVRGSTPTFCLRCLCVLCAPGTFLARERVATLYEFVRTALADSWQPFELLAPGGQKLKEDEEVAINECNLVPAAVVTFSWDAAVQADIAAAGGQSAKAIFKAELLENIRTLS